MFVGSIRMRAGHEGFDLGLNYSSINFNIVGAGFIYSVLTG